MLTQPLNGVLATDEPGRVAVSIAGTHGEHEQLSVQLLADPNDLTSWQTVATTTADSPTQDPDQYGFAVDVKPGASGVGEWPRGGVVRLRVIDQSGAALLAPGASSGDGVVVLGNPSGTPAAWTFLTEKPVGSAAETSAYYAAIGAPATLTDFLTTYGFGDASDVAATYYNAGDLGIGREMHCRATDVPAGGVACYVRNFGTFGGGQPDAIAKLVAGGTPLATVAMVYTPPITAADAVRFVVYNGAGHRATSAQLDTHGNNTSIPQNCLNCHGGSSTYDPASHSVTGAQFLAFDPAAFAFAAQPGLSLADQQSQLDELNSLVLATSPTNATRELVESLSDDVDVAQPWRQSLADRAMYQQVIAPYCRGCHASQISAARGDALQLSTPDQVRNQRGAIANMVCNGSRAMPVAEATATRFFTSNARAVLVSWLQLPGTCAPR